jgi:hypothetical protein
MEQEIIYNENVFILAPAAKSRAILTQNGAGKWQSCVYSSPYDCTGQVLLFLKSITSGFEGRFLKNPIYVYMSYDKVYLETQLDNKLKSLIKNGKNKTQ